jgi:uncharacterized protein YggE
MTAVAYTDKVKVKRLADEAIEKAIQEATHRGRHLVGIKNCRQGQMLRAHRGENGTVPPPRQRWLKAVASPQ